MRYRRFSAKPADDVCYGATERLTRELYLYCGCLDANLYATQIALRFLDGITLSRAVTHTLTPQASQNAAVIERCQFVTSWRSHAG